MKVIVTTTINPPTKAILKFAQLKDWKLYIVGDLKTPHELFKNKSWKYLSPDYQKTNYSYLSDLIGWNSIQRRNIGFIEAIKDGAEIIATVDDDNIPYENWGKQLLIGQRLEIDSYSNPNGLFDPLSVTNISNKYWHRGYPLSMVSKRNQNLKTKKIIDVKVQVDLWNGKPDADAISRLMNGYKDEIITGPFPYSSERTILSSQNAFFHKSIMKNYAVFPHCDRMDDIWGCIILQKDTNCDVVFSSPSTFHDRNYHNPIDDLRQEIIGHEKTLSILKNKNALPEACQLFFSEYQKEIINATLSK